MRMVLPVVELSTVRKIAITTPQRSQLRTGRTAWRPDHGYYRFASLEEANAFLTGVEVRVRLVTIELKHSSSAPIVIVEFSNVHVKIPPRAKRVLPPNER